MTDTADAVKKWLLGVAIAVVLTLFFNYGVGTFYKGPKESDYCKEAREPFPAKPFEPVEQRTECLPVHVSDELRKNCTSDVGYISYRYNATGCPTEAFCETCYVEYSKVRNVYESNVFIILTVLGSLAIIAGIALKSPAVSLGVLIGGLLTVIFATMRQWAALQDVLRFVLLALMLALLLFVAYKKFGKQ